MRNKNNDESTESKNGIHVVITLIGSHPDILKTSN